MMNPASPHTPAATDFSDTIGIRDIAAGLLLPARALLLLGACLVFIVVTAMTGLTTQGE